MRFLTATAERFAFATNVITTPVTRVAVVLSNHRSAVGTMSAAPQRQLDEWTLGVVSPQHVCHEHEEIQQPAFGKCQPDRMLSVSLAKKLVHDMRMGHTVTRLCGMRIFGNDSIRCSLRIRCLRPIQL